MLSGILLGHRLTSDAPVKALIAQLSSDWSVLVLSRSLVGSAEFVIPALIMFICIHRAIRKGHLNVYF